MQSQRYEAQIKAMLPKEDMTFRIVDWPDRLQIFSSRDEFFTDTSIELLSLGKVVVCDRLHAAILSYLVGLPFVFIDQISGKISKTFRGTFEGIDGCLDGEKAGWAQATSLQEALKVASDMLEKQNLRGRGQGMSGMMSSWFS